MTKITRKIIALNVLVFVLWYTLDVNFMIENFLVSSESVMAGRFWTLLTSVFSHNAPEHILINMFVFYGFGRVMEDLLGPLRFLGFYLFAGLLGSVSHCLTSSLLIGNPTLPALGASGAISGVLVIYSILFPRQKILLLGLIPLPAFVGTILFIGLDLWGLLTQARGGGLPIGHGAHLGGALAGFLYYFFYLRSRLELTDTAD